jgi:hypothetical protein
LEAPKTQHQGVRRDGSETISAGRKRLWPRASRRRRISHSAGLACAAAVRTAGRSSREPVASSSCGLQAGGGEAEAQATRSEDSTGGGLPLRGRPEVGELLLLNRANFRKKKDAARVRDTGAFVIIHPSIPTFERWWDCIPRPVALHGLRQPYLNVAEIAPSAQPWARLFARWKCVLSGPAVANRPSATVPHRLVGLGHFRRVTRQFRGPAQEPARYFGAAECGIWPNMISFQPSTKSGCKNDVFFPQLRRHYAEHEANAPEPRNCPFVLRQYYSPSARTLFAFPLSSPAFGLPPWASARRLDPLRRIHVLPPLCQRRCKN